MNTDINDFYFKYAEELYWFVCELFYSEWRESGCSMAEFIEFNPVLKDKFCDFINAYEG